MRPVEPSSPVFVAIDMAEIRTGEVLRGNHFRHSSGTNLSDQAKFTAKFALFY
jgi:hypothetical protein